MPTIAPIVIKRLNESNFYDADKCDGSFVIDSELVLSAHKGKIYYEIVSVEPYKKRYVPEKDRDLRIYIDSPRGAVYLAYIDDRVCGQMILSWNWNNFALIEDLEVDVDFRRQGVGRGLIEQAKVWGRAMGLAGVTLETQNNNVSACAFYEQSGFVLCGFDSNLYRGMNSDTTEIALYWYYFFKDDELLVSEP
jgi:ribosomal protein S18 acetylase RimI-like enzyme